VLFLYIVHSHISYVNITIKESEIIDTEKYNYEIDLDDVIVVKTDQSFGEAVSRIRRRDVIKIPDSCSNPNDFLTVLHHEYYHISENHKYKTDLILFLMLSFSLSVSTLFTLNISLLLLALSSLLIVFIVNIYRHRIEYRADNFAGNHISNKYVIDRIREYPNRNRYQDFKKYIYPYPPLTKRIQNQTN
jgi:hypothetical protein